MAHSRPEDEAEDEVEGSILGTPRNSRTTRSKERGNAVTAIAAAALFPLTRLLARRRFVGYWRIPEHGPALVVANHISHLDPVFDVIFVRMSGRLPHVMAKASLWDIPVVRWVLNGTGQIPVKRGKGAGQEALADATQALADGKVVLIYPEGTVTKDPDHWPMRPRPGVAALALSGDFPVIPVAHWGTQRVYRSYGEGPRFAPLPRKDVHVVAGEPIDLSQWRRGAETSASDSESPDAQSPAPPDKRAILQVSTRVMEHIRGMMAALRDETAPTRLFNPLTAAKGPNGTKPDGAKSDGAKNGAAHGATGSSGQ